VGFSLTLNNHNNHNRDPNDHNKLQELFAKNVPQFCSSAPLGQSFLPSHRRANGTHEPSRQVKSEAGQGATKAPT
jgi:hypothetical protein